MKKQLLSILLALLAGNVMAQSLEKMNWFNEPEVWKIENKALTMSVTPQSDYCVFPTMVSL